MEDKLSPLQTRVLGCLIEKELGTPEYYPLTLNSLTTACNQKSNRAPILALEEDAVMAALDELRYTHLLVGQVTLSGSRVPKFKHNMQALYAFTQPQLAILCELMVRGPQTIGELRVHASRLHNFASLQEVQTVLDELAAMEKGPLVTYLPREPGRREQRYAQLLGIDSPSTDTPTSPTPTDTVTSPIRPQPGTDRLTALEAEVTTLKEALLALQAQFAEFRKQFE